MLTLFKEPGKASMGTFTQRTWRPDPNALASRRHRRPCEYSAYVPDLLRDLSLLIPGDLAADIADAERAVVALNASHTSAGDLEALARVLLRAESIASSQIEGLTVAHRRLLRFEAARMSGVPLADATAQAVLGNVAAMQAAIAVADEAAPLTVDDLLAIHVALMRESDHATWGGRLREEQNWIRGQTPCVAEFVPPPPEDVPRLLGDLCDFVNADDLPPLVQAAVAHAQFETIHPFLDGNGRAGRALIHVILRRRGLAPRYVPPISLALATAADAYVAGLTAFRFVGDANSDAARRGLREWLEVATTATLRACREAERLAAELEQLRATWRARVQPRRNSTADLLLDVLVRAPVVTVGTAAAMVDRSKVAAGNAIDQLVTAGVLSQTTVGKRNRAFEATDVFDVLVGYERALASPTGDTVAAPPVRPAPVRPVPRP
jgi:Fic family protein